VKAALLESELASQQTLSWRKKRFIIPCLKAMEKFGRLFCQSTSKLVSQHGIMEFSAAKSRRLIVKKCCQKSNNENRYRDNLAKIRGFLYFLARKLLNENLVISNTNLKFSNVFSKGVTEYFHRR
jgi:hypothetical protein